MPKNPNACHSGRKRNRLITCTLPHTRGEEEEVTQVKRTVVEFDPGQDWKYGQTHRRDCGRRNVEGKEGRIGCRGGEACPWCWNRRKAGTAAICGVGGKGGRVSVKLYLGIRLIISGGTHSGGACYRTNTSATAREIKKIVTNSSVHHRNALANQRRQTRINR